MARQKRVKNATSLSPVADLYPDGVPLDGNGMPVSGAEIDPTIAKTIPLDRKSAREVHRFRMGLNKKAAGVKGIRWDADDRLKFLQLKEMQPQCTISIEQTSPRKDLSIPRVQLAELQTFEDLLDYARYYWSGEPATYKWLAWDARNPMWAQGTFSFQAREETDEMRRNQPGQPPQNPYIDPSQWVQTPQGWWHPQVGYAPPNAVMPPPQSQAAPPPLMQQPPMPQPQPIILPNPTPGTSPDVVQQLVAALAAAQAQNAQLLQRSYTPQQQPQPQQVAPQQPQAPPNSMMVWSPQYNAWIAIPQVQAQQQQPAEQQRSKTPSEEAADAVGNMMKMLALGRRLAADFSPEKPTENPTAPVAPPPDEMPLHIQEVGPVRFVEHRDGTRVDPFTHFMFNLDKLGDAVSASVKKGKELLEERRKIVEEQNKTNVQTSSQEDAENRALARAREATELQERQANALSKILSLQGGAGFQQPPQPPPSPLVPNPEEVETAAVETSAVEAAEMYLGIPDPDSEPPMPEEEEDGPPEPPAPTAEV